MKYILLLFICLCFGCESQPIIDKVTQESMEAAKKVAGKKVLTIRVTENSVDLVMDEGELITIYGYRVDGGRMLSTNVGVK